MIEKTWKNEFKIKKLSFFVISIRHPEGGGVTKQEQQQGTNY